MDLASQPAANFSSCISLCDGYNNACFASVFYNATVPAKCVLKANGTTPTVMKRDTAALAYQNQVFVAYHLANPNVYQV